MNFQQQKERLRTCRIRKDKVRAGEAASASTRAACAPQKAGAVGRECQDRALRKNRRPFQWVRISTSSRSTGSKRREDFTCKTQSCPCRIRARGLTTSPRIKVQSAFNRLLIGLKAARCRFYLVSVTANEIISSRPIFGRTTFVF